MDKIVTDNQVETMLRVREAHRAGKWYRARSSGERVTLASLFRRGILERQAWRGNEGEADAAHEYRVSSRIP
jgi:hypothetical protein